MEPEAEGREKRIKGRGMLQMPGAGRIG